MRTELDARVEAVERACLKSVEALGVRFERVEDAVRGDGLQNIGILARLSMAETNIKEALYAQRRILWGVLGGIGVLLTFVAVEILRSYMSRGAT